MMRRPLSRRHVVAVHVGVPRSEDATRVVATDPDVQSPKAELGHLGELLAQQLGWRRGRGMIREGYDVLHSHKPKLSVFLRLEQQELGLEQRDPAAIVDECELAIVEAHSTEFRILQAAGDLNRPARRL